MAKSGGSRGAPKRRTGRDAAPRRTGASPAGRSAQRSRTGPPAEKPQERTTSEPGTFVLGAVPGATPGKWIDVWRERMPHVGLELRTIAVATQRNELLATPAEDRDAATRVPPIDAALVRLPIDREGLHVIPLYEELPVVVVSKDSHLTAADELDLADLAGEIVIVPADDVLAFEVPGAVAPVFDPPETTADAIATVATGVGLVVVPMSLARLHQRRDVASIPLREGPMSEVALAWQADRTTPHVETFVGIVRGRTSNSSRG
ncbi:LysR family substrate-binding domain-containing protein [Microbacterium sp. AZCO]|uniref:LysR family substrate-binding domain-containing protein n=1 Tax=Microbacterium sp. AZCO TaxID=3142976 RepID=UPI0031F3A432